MNDNTLRQLLTDADAAAGLPPATTRDLAAAIHQRLRRRRRSQFASLSIILCGLLALVPLLHKDPTPSITIKTDPSKIQAELLQIRLQADAHSAAIDRMVQHQRLAQIRTAAARIEQRGEPLDRLQRQRELAARILVHDANRLFQQTGHASAAAHYRRVIDLYPDTHWAALARARLAQNRT